jgi:predicted TIM-barrel fold metal-dependent hydrolase
VVLDALAIFGIKRAMFAPNFPVAGLRIGYGALVAAISGMLHHLSPADRDRFFWKNAKAFYRLQEQRESLARSEPSRTAAAV